MLGYIGFFHLNCFPLATQGTQGVIFEWFSMQMLVRGVCATAFNGWFKQASVKEITSLGKRCYK